MKQKLVTLILALCCTLNMGALASCQMEQNNSSSTSQKESIEESTSTGESTADSSSESDASTSEEISSESSDSTSEDSSSESSDSSSESGDSSETETDTTTYTRVDKDNTPNEEGEYILFGSYPQTNVTDTSIINALNEQAGILPTTTNNYDWTSYGYYQGTDEKNSQSNATNYMWYQDETYNGEKYRGVYFVSYRPEYTYYSSNFSKTSQDDNGYDAITRYWFKYEPIQWRILSESSGYALILSEMLIDSQEFYHTTQTREIDGQTIYSNNYAKSNIRAWLNDTFYNTAFNSLQKQLIQLTEVDNSASTTDSPTNPYACENTIDNIYLLSYQECQNFVPNLQKKTASDYAQCQGYDTLSGDLWWLRSNYNSDNIYVVSTSHNAINGNSVDQTSRGICPALKIHLS